MSQNATSILDLIIRSGRPTTTAPSSRSVPVGRAGRKMVLCKLMECITSALLRENPPATGQCASCVHRKYMRHGGLASNYYVLYKQYSIGRFMGSAWKLRTPGNSHGFTFYTINRSDYSTIGKFLSLTGLMIKIHGSVLQNCKEDRSSRNTY